MLQIRHLAKQFGPLRAVDDVSFDVETGEVVALLGPNGAGKTTTMKMIAGYLEPDTGAISISGHSVVTDRRQAQTSLGYLPEGAPLYPDMSPRDYLRFHGRLRGMTGEAAEKRIEAIAIDTRITDVLRKPIAALSKGYRRRVAMAAALFHDPPVLMLDEPTDGLDPNQKQAVRALIARLAQTKAILISTHSLDEVAAMCSQVILMDRGRIVVDEPYPSFRARNPMGNLEAVFQDLTKTSELVTA